MTPPPPQRDPLNDPRLERPRSWWDDPQLSLDALSPGQRYTAAITLVLAVALMAFGVERGQGGGPGFEVPMVETSRPTMAPADGSPNTMGPTPPTPLAPLENPVPPTTDEAPPPTPSTTTTTTSPPPSTPPTTQPPEEEDPPDDRPPVPLPPLPADGQPGVPLPPLVTS